MSRTRKATKRAASRRHHSATVPTGSRHPSSHASTSPSATPTSASPAQPVQQQCPQPRQTRQEPQESQTRQDRRAHPDQAALKERAFALSCIGLRSPAIASRLGVSERTIRHWNYTTLRTLALDATGLSPDLDTPADLDASGGTPTTTETSTTSTTSTTSAPDAAPAPDTYRMEYHRALAIERQLDIAVTARAAYDRLMAQHDHLLAQYIASCDANITATAATVAYATAATDEAAAAPPLPAALASMARLIPQLASSASRQLQIAQAAHREVARLQGVTTYAQTDARLSAEFDARQAQQASDSADEESGHVPIRFFDPTAAIAAITGGLDDDDDDDDSETATSAPAQNASPLSGATSPATTASGSGNNSGNISGNGTSHTAFAAQSMPDPNPLL